MKNFIKFSARSVIQISWRSDSRAKWSRIGFERRVSLRRRLYEDRLRPDQRPSWPRRRPNSRSNFNENSEQARRPAFKCPQAASEPVSLVALFLSLSLFCKYPSPIFLFLNLLSLCWKRSTSPSPLCLSISYVIRCVYRTHSFRSLYQFVN